MAWSAVTPTGYGRRQVLEERPKERPIDGLDNLLLEHRVPVMTGLVRPFQMDVNERETAEKLSRHSSSLSVARVAVGSHGSDVAVLQEQHRAMPLSTGISVTAAPWTPCFSSKEAGGTRGSAPAFASTSSPLAICFPPIARPGIHAVPCQNGSSPIQEQIDCAGGASGLGGRVGG